MTDQQFTAAAEAYTDMVYRIALNWFRNVPDAEDVTQNTMLRLCRTDTAFADEEHLRYWLVRVGGERVQTPVQVLLAHPDGASGELPGAGFLRRAPPGGVSGGHGPARKVPGAPLPVLL